MFTRLGRPILVALAASLLLAAILAVGTVAVPAARADAPIASLVYDIGDSNLVAGEIGPIDRGLKGRFEFNRGTRREAWGCIKELKEFGEDRNENPDPEPLAPLVRVDVRVSRAHDDAPVAGVIYHGDYTMVVTLTIRGQAAKSASAQVEPADLVPVTFGPGGTEQEDIRRIAQKAQDMLDALMGESQPCKPKAKVRIKGGASLPSLNETLTMEGEGDLGLREDGTTDAAFPVTFTHVQSGACEITSTATGRMQVSGGYRERDGALTLRMRLSIDPASGTGTCGGGIAQCVMGGGTITCTTAGGSATQPSPGLELDLTPGDGIAVALADQASAALPRPAGWPEILSWDGSLELAYGGGAGAVVVVSATSVSATP
jgi:hypothetical protein